jgi:hypothetical protein
MLMASPGTVLMGASGWRYPAWCWVVYPAKLAIPVGVYVRFGPLFRITQEGFNFADAVCSRGIHYARSLLAFTPRVHSSVDQVFPIEVLFGFLAAPGSLQGCVGNEFRRKSAQILSLSKECHAKENRSAQ